MKTRWCVWVICAGMGLYAVLSQAAPVVKNSAPMSLGVVSGRVVNETLSLEQGLSNPVLLSIAQSELDSPLRSLWVDRAVGINNQHGEVTIKLTSPVSGGVMETLLTLEVWLDGQRANVLGETQGNGVQINIDTPFRFIEVRASKPLKIQIPKYYRGPFNFAIDIEAQA